jgi:hypothetical protein
MLSKESTRSSSKSPKYTRLNLSVKLPGIVATKADEQYDYPSDIAESVQDMSSSAASAWSSFANKNLKVSLRDPFLRVRADIRTLTSQVPLRANRHLISQRPFLTLWAEPPRTELQISEVEIGSVQL